MDLDDDDNDMTVTLLRPIALQEGILQHCIINSVTWKSFKAAKVLHNLKL